MISLTIRITDIFQDDQVCAAGTVRPKALDTMTPFLTVYNSKRKFTSKIWPGILARPLAHCCGRLEFAGGGQGGYDCAGGIHNDFD